MTTFILCWSESRSQHPGEKSFSQTMVSQKGRNWIFATGIRNTDRGNKINLSGRFKHSENTAFAAIFTRIHGEMSRELQRFLDMRPHTWLRCAQWSCQVSRHLYAFSLFFLSPPLTLINSPCESETEFDFDGERWYSPLKYCTKRWSDLINMRVYLIW